MFLRADPMRTRREADCSRLVSLSSRGSVRLSQRSHGSLAIALYADDATREAPPAICRPAGSLSPRPRHHSAGGRGAALPVDLKIIERTLIDKCGCVAAAARDLGVRARDRRGRTSAARRAGEPGSNDAAQGGCVFSALERCRAAAAAGAGRRVMSQPRCKPSRSSGSTSPTRTGSRKRIGRDNCG